MIPADTKRVKYIKNKMMERADMRTMENDEGEDHFPREQDFEKTAV